MCVVPSKKHDNANCCSLPAPWPPATSRILLLLPLGLASSKVDSQASASARASFWRAARSCSCRVVFYFCAEAPARKACAPPTPGFPFDSPRTVAHLPVTRADPFAFVYSHTSGWNRHRGAGNKVSGGWSGTWDGAQKGSQFKIRLTCANRRFALTTERQSIAVFSYPASWAAAPVYAAAGGQSTNHIYRMEDRACGTDAPTTVAPVTSAPMTAAPTSSPVTLAPTRPPSTASPTQVPTSSAPTYDMHQVVGGIDELRRLYDALDERVGSSHGSLALGRLAEFAAAVAQDPSDPPEQHSSSGEPFLQSTWHTPSFHTCR